MSTNWFVMTLRYLDKLFISRSSDEFGYCSVRFGSTGQARLVNEARARSGACAGWANTRAKYDSDWDSMESGSIMKGTLQI